MGFVVTFVFNVARMGLTCSYRLSFVEISIVSFSLEVEVVLFLPLCVTCVNVLWSGLIV